MPSKRELAAEASTLGKQLGVEVDVARKNHAELTELVEGLRRRAQAAADAPAGAAEPDAGGDAPELDVEPEVTIGTGVRRATPPPAVPEAERPRAGASALDQLIELVAAQAPEAGPSSGAATPRAGSGPAEPRRPAKVTGYRVAPGKLLTTLRGYLRAGDAVVAGDLAGGRSTLELLLEKGVIEPR